MMSGPHSQESQEAVADELGSAVAKGSVAVMLAVVAFGAVGTCAGWNDSRPPEQNAPLTTTTPTEHIVQH